MKRTVLADAITYFFILLFLYTGAAKLIEIQTFKEQLISSPFFSSLAGVISWMLPIGEIILAVALFIPSLRLKSLYFTLALMSFFTVYVLAIYLIDNHLSCSCGGIIEELTPRQHIIFNLSCVILSLIAITILKRQQPTNNVRWVAGSAALCLFFVISWTLFTAFTAPTISKTGLEGRPLFSFDLLLTDSLTHLNTSDIPKGQPFIVFGFDPYCTHCQAETDDIIKHISEFKNIHIYYITPYPFDRMKAFYDHFKLARFPNITMGRDPKSQFFSYFKVKVIPYAAIFDSQKRLKMVFASQTSAEKLAHAAAE